MLADIIKKGSLQILITHEEMLVNVSISPAARCQYFVSNKSNKNYLGKLVFHFFRNLKIWVLPT